MITRERKINLARRMDRLLRFIQYWSVQRKGRDIDPTVAIGLGSRVSDSTAIGRYTYIGHNTHIASGTIGAFCSISWNVTIGADEHPIHAVSKHPFWYSPSHSIFRADELRWAQAKKPPQIGHDVWIGAGATILRGAVIEDGAVIAAGAIVSGIVPAYSVVGGVPAKVIRILYEEDTVRRLRSTGWWDWEVEKLKEAAPLFGNTEAFLNKYENLQGVKEVIQRAEHRQESLSPEQRQETLSPMAAPIHSILDDSRN